MRHVPFAIERAAELLASGVSFTVIATTVGWSVQRLKRWIRANQADWYRAYYRARRAAHELAFDEAVSILRNQLRGEKEKTVHSAASSLTSQCGPSKLRPRSQHASSTQDDRSTFRDWLAATPEQETTRVDLHIQASEDEDHAASAGDCESAN